MPEEGCLHLFRDRPKNQRCNFAEEDMACPLFIVSHYEFYK